MRTEEEIRLRIRGLYEKREELMDTPDLEDYATAQVIGVCASLLEWALEET